MMPSRWAQTPSKRSPSSKPPGLWLHPLPGEHGVTADSPVSLSPQSVTEAPQHGLAMLGVPHPSGHCPAPSQKSDPQPLSSTSKRAPGSVTPTTLSTQVPTKRSRSHLSCELHLLPMYASAHCLPLRRPPSCSSPGNSPLGLVTLQTLPKQAPSLSPAPSPCVRRWFPKGTAHSSPECPGCSDPTTNMVTRGRVPGLSSEVHSMQHADTADSTGPAPPESSQVQVLSHYQRKYKCLTRVHHVREQPQSTQ